MKNTDFKTTLKATIFTFFALIGMNCSAVHAANAVGENASDSSFQVTVTTGNNQITQGKKLATDAYYLKPAIHYSYKQGFYIDLSGNYIPDFKKNSFSSMNVGTGYNFDLGNNISTGIDYSYTYNISKKELLSSAPNDLSWNLGWDNPVLSPSLNLDYSFGTTNDISAGLDLSHSFAINHIFCSSDKISVPLSISTTFATANFYKAYVTKNHVKNKKTKTEVNPATVDTSFGISDFSLSASFSYQIKNFSLTPAVSYQVPFGSAADITGNTPVFTMQVGYIF